MRTYNLGVLYGVPNVSNPTPIPIASLKGCKVGIKQSKKGFRGNQRDLIDVGDGARDWSIEIDSADFRAEALKLVVPGGTTVTGGRLVAIAEGPTTIPGTPFQVTVSQSANWAEDAGVLDLTAGVWMTRGATATGTGVYSVAAGVYTFNTSDASHVVYISYAYTSASLGRTTTISNSIQSASTPFKLRVYDPYQVRGGTIRLAGLDFYSVHFEELSLDFKVEDFAAFGLKGVASQDMIGTSLKVCDAYDSEKEST